MKTSERIFNIIDRSREFIEIRCGVDLLAIAELPPLNTTLEFLSDEADRARDEVAQLEAENEALKREVLNWEMLYGKYPGGPALLTRKETP